MSFHFKLIRLGFFLLGISGIFAAFQAAAAFPDKAIRMIVPFAPGGGTDQISRALGAGMAKELGQPVVIENKPGAGTVIGMDTVASCVGPRRLKMEESWMFTIRTIIKIIWIPKTF